MIIWTNQEFWGFDFHHNYSFGLLTCVVFFIVPARNTDYDRKQLAHAWDGLPD